MSGEPPRVNHTFHITRVVLDGILAHAREARPAECCGVLIGREHEIVEAVRIRNVAHELTRYLLDPKDHIDARRAARQRGLDVIGFYHSHPHSSAEPSPTDLAEASYPDHVYLIVSLLPDRAEGAAEKGSVGAAEARLFRFGHEVSTEVPLVVSEAAFDGGESRT